MGACVPCPPSHVEEPGAPQEDLASPGGCLDISLDPARARGMDTGSSTYRNMGLWVAERRVKANDSDLGLCGH